MKASEANKIATFGREVDQQALSEAYQIIESKANAGQRRTAITYNAKTRTIIEQLKADGYKVQLLDDRNETIIMISWDNDSITTQPNDNA
jgi:hypothetical protein